MTDESPTPAEPVLPTVGSTDTTEPTPKARRLTPLTIGLIATAGALVLVLVAVGVVFAVTQPPKAGAVDEPSPTATSPAPTDSPIVVTAPVPRIGVPCSSLLPAITLSLVTSVRLDLVDDGLGTPDELWWAAERQRGVLRCVWGGGTGRTDGGWDNGVTVSIEAEASAAYRTNFDQNWSYSSAYFVRSPVGDDSIYTCSVWGEGYSCTGELLTGTTWSSVTASGASAGVSGQDDANARFEAVLNSIDASIRSGGPLRARWAAPDGVLDPLWFCGDLGDPAAPSLVSSAWNLGSLVPPMDDYPDERFLAAGGKSCGWNQVSGDQNWVGVSMLKGGAWSLDTMESDPPDVWWLGDFAPVEVAGADRAYVACGDGCKLAMSIAGSRVEVTLPIMETDAIVAGAPALVEALRNH